MQRTNGSRALYLPNLAIVTVVLGCLLYGFSLDRYPGFYVDDVVFAYPALEAALGRPFVYPGSTGAPYVGTLWAYHGPVLPNLDIVIFKVFGFSTAISRLPDFLGGWIAALLIVLFLKKKGYRYAGLAFAVLWCGDRTVQEIMYGRMDGLALLSVVLSFLCLEAASTEASAMAMYGCGIFCGLSMLIHPLCWAFAAAAFVVIWYRAGWRGAARFSAGGLLNLPLLLALWRFHPQEAIQQFMYVAGAMEKIMGITRAVRLLQVLRWSKYWFVALFVVAIGCAVLAAGMLWRRRIAAWAEESDFLLASIYTLAATLLLCRSTLYPYYLVYFSLWPMLCVVLLAERHWRSFRPIAVVLGVVWCTSAAWNAMRLREPIRLYSTLSHGFLRAELKRDIPPDARVVTTSDLYAIPIESGFTHRGLTTFAPEHQDIDPRSYVLITADQYEAGQYIPRSNLDQRKILYSGPAFPGAGPLAFPVVVLSPEGAASGH